MRLINNDVKSIVVIDGVVCESMCSIKCDVKLICYSGFFFFKQKTAYEI